MKQLTFLLIAISFIAFSCGQKEKETPSPVTDTGNNSAELPTEQNAFPDFGYMVSLAEYDSFYSDQPIFRLKADFPMTKPTKLPDFLSIDFKKEPLKYIEAVRDYAFEGNLPDWDPFKNKVREWYHIPWLHPSATGPGAYPPNGGTEGFRGLIKEAGVNPYQLGPDQKGVPGDYSVYAITLVNDMAGYAMGRMWKNPEKPDPTVLDKRYPDGGFPDGTVFAKLLFTDAPKGTDRIDYLVNPLQWTAFITENFWTSSKRVVGKVNLLQMDIAVRDPRADRSPSNPEGTGWVFGTFCYNGQLNKENKFMNLVPVGLMWGNDPQDTVSTINPYPFTKTIVNPKLKETTIFASNDLPPQHLGWNGRLNGPADLNSVSCISCHNAAQYPQITSLIPPGAPTDGTTVPDLKKIPNWMDWFQNYECATTMNPQTYSTDFSFQVAIALQNFFTVNNAAKQGLWADEYRIDVAPISRGETSDSN
jgi:hypothetical protein